MSLKNDQNRSRRLAREQQLQVLAATRANDMIPQMPNRALHSLIAALQVLIERQNKELSELLWKRSEIERALIAAETTFAQVV